MRNIVTFFVFYFCFSLHLFSQVNEFDNLSFEHLSIEHGLSQITVHSILQDSKGFIWFGTEDGLNRYDGYNFTIFRYDESDTNSIRDNFIWALFEDSQNNIWIGTNSGGLCRYDYATNSFLSYLSKFENPIGSSPNNIRTIFEDSDSNLWIGTENTGLYVRKKNSEQFIRFDDDRTNAFSIRAICQDNFGKLWFGTNESGLYYSENLDHKLIKDEEVKSNSIWALSSDNSGGIWIGTYIDGLLKLSSAGIIERKYSSSIQMNSLINNNITDILVDGNYLWICTDGGLSILNTKDNIFSNYAHNLSNLRSLSNSFLRVIIKDKSNLIWIGTVGGGINKVNLNKKFNQFTHNPTDENSLSHNMIRAIEEDSERNIWIGTLGSGINRLNENTNEFRRINSSNSNLTEDIVTSIFEDKKRNLWVGTWGGGLNQFRFSQRNKNSRINFHKSFLHNPLSDNSISSNIIQDIFEDSKGNLWIGTEGGLDRYDSQLGVFHRYRYDPQDSNSISDNRIQSRCIIEDRFGYLWIGTWQGLNRIYLGAVNSSDEDLVFERYFKEDGLSDNRIISIIEDVSNTSSDSLTLWIGTIGGGLNRLTTPNGRGRIEEFQFDSFTERDGFPSNVIYGILNDNDGNLWMSTNDGLSKFKPKTGEIRNYNIDDGLQSNQFFWGAFHKSKNGELYFGGINGVNSFNPENLLENDNVPPLFITKLNIESADGNRKFSFNNIVELKQLNGLRLPYDSYNVSVEYVALDLTIPKKNSYKYMLKGIDENWREITNNNFAEYTNVGDGDYDFSVVGSNNDGIWNETGATISFIIETPFWKAWWFILIIIALIAALIFYLVITQIKNMLAVERIRTKLAADLHDNIGSSLTEISILTEVITTRLKSEDKEVEKNLGKISTKSRNLIDKMSDIVWLVNPKRDSLYDLILRLQDSYSDLLSDTSISFTCENLKSLEKVSLSMEHRQHLFLVFKEAINNAITHSNCTELLLNSNVSGKILKMTLKDNGDGFDVNMESHGNGLDNMKERSSKIGGKLNITSEKGIGTVVNYFGYIH